MKKIIYLVSIITLLSSCSKKEKEPTTLSVNFTQTVDGETLLMLCCGGKGNFPYTNEAGEKYNIQTLKYIISNIILHDGDGNSILIKDFHFVDLADELTWQFETEQLSNGNYTSLSLSMGLDESMNISDVYLNEAWHASMLWPNMMGGGYHYMKLEGAYNNDSTFYNTHTGSTAGIDYSFNIDLPINLNIENDLGNIAIDINMEINNWYKNPNTYNLSGGIMGDTSKQISLQQNGFTDVFSISIN